MSYTLIWEQNDGAESQSLQSGSSIAGGLAFYTGHIMIGEIPTKVTCSLQKIDAPTGTATLKLIASDNSVKTIFGTIDASTLTTSFIDYNFINDLATSAVSDGDILAWFYSGSSSFKYEMAATATSANTLQKYSSDAINWSAYPAGLYPSTVKIYKAGPPTITTRLPPPPITVRL